MQNLLQISFISVIACPSVAGFSLSPVFPTCIDLHSPFYLRKSEIQNLNYANLNYIVPPPTKRLVAVSQKKYRSDAIESDEVLQRQRVLTDAMNLLSKWDEEQTEFVLKYADSNAPLGDWRGLRKVLNDEERIAMQKACITLCEDAAYVLLGLNAETESEARLALDEWIKGLGLPVPASVPYMDDVSGLEYNTVEDMPDDFRALLNGPVHVAYNSKAGADPGTGDDSNAPAKAHLMPYPAPDRGVVFTPILEGFFTQYGDVPLDLYSPLDAAARLARQKAAAAARDPNLAALQHAALGNAEAAKSLFHKAATRPVPPPE